MAHPTRILLFALLAAAVAAPALAAPRHHVSHEGDIYVHKPKPNFYFPPLDREVGVGNAYIADTRQPLYALGAPFIANTGGFENLPENRDPFWQPPYSGYGGQGERYSRYGY